VPEGTCHCGAVRITIPRKPQRLSSCNCSVCRRYGTLWAYYPARTVRVRAARGATEAYVWGDRSIRFVRCRACGCVTHWEPVRRTADARMGINTRNFDPAVMAAIPVRHFDGAASWKFLD
jgi:hypothetical protein